MENDVMMNEEVIEVTEELAEVESNKGLIALGVGAAVIVGVIAYKKIVKPVVAKIKAKKADKEVAEIEDVEVVEVDSDED